MNQGRYGQVKQLFAAALEYAAAERADFLARACAGDDELRGEVESLLAHDEPASRFIEESAFEVTARLLAAGEAQALTAQRIGPYRVLDEIGRGGMGVVYLAVRDDDQFHKQVAIKLIKRGMDTDAVVRRFRNERQILADLEHPNIARLLDGGTTDTGLPYLVMEYVAGTPVTDYCDTQRLKTNERLHLFRTICAAVQSAHQNLVVHRDLKPSNILVTVDGTPKLLDFGIAKVLNAEAAAHAPEQTRTELRALTPDYASPEQVRGEKLTTASDVYSLGVILYELLTGHRPYRAGSAPPHELARVICEQVPTKPSTAVSHVEVVTHGEAAPQTTITPETVSRARDTQPDKLRRRLAGDLDNIVLKALRKEPARRYESAAQLAADIQRHLAGLPVSARKDTFKYRTAKFVRRNRLGVAAAALILLVMLGGLIATAWQARVAARERDQAREEKAKAEQLNKFLQGILSAASPEEKGKDAKVIEVLHDAARRIDTELAGQPALKAQALQTIGETYNKLGLMDEAEESLRAALRINSALYGADSRAAAASMIELSLPLLNKNRLAEAESLLQQGIAAERKLTPADSRELAFGLSVLGELYVRRGEYEKPKPLLQEALAIYDRSAGPHNEDSALTLVSLGRAQQFAGDTGEAEANYRKSVAIYRQLPARYAGRLATVLLNLGLLLTTKGDFDEGIKAIREADDIFVQHGESFYLFESKSYLCIAFANKGDHERAIAEGRKAVELGRKLGLTEAPDFISALRLQGVGLTRTGRAKEAEPLLREALARAEKISPPGGVAIANAEGALGECLTAQHRFAAAEPLVLHSYEALKTSLGEKNTYTVTGRRRAFDLYDRWRRPDLAAKFRAIQ